jgi:hypothetical protein
MALLAHSPQGAELARKAGAIDAIGLNHQGNHGVVEQSVNPAVQHRGIHGGSFPLAADTALRKRRQG